MSMIATVTATIGTVVLAGQLASSVLAVRRLTQSNTALGSAICYPPISIIRPVCGLTDIERETLRSAFFLDYPDFEIILCAEREQDPAVPYCRQLLAEFPNVRASVLVGRSTVSANPKLDNIEKGWLTAAHEWIVLADSNVLMPPNYLQHLMTCWKKDCGLVAAPPVGIRPDGFWAEVEAAFLNTYQARWQYAADAVGMGYAQGKSMLWQRSFLEDRGGIGALASEIAEDAAATKLVRAAGRCVRLADRPSLQPLGRRSLVQVWQRQLRWAQLRRHSFPKEFSLEIFSSFGGALFGAIGLAALMTWPIGIAVLSIAILWFACEAWLSTKATWPWGWRSVAASLCREVILLAAWCTAWVSSSYVWHGQQVSLGGKPGAAVT